jgi:hypothetical protein
MSSIAPVKSAFLKAAGSGKIEETKEIKTEAQTEA